jgi:hypothetical protein
MFLALAPISFGLSAYGFQQQRLWLLEAIGTITFEANLEEARRLLASALVDMAEANLLRGEPLPHPDPSCTDPEADLEEPIHFRLRAM